MERCISTPIPNYLSTLKPHSTQLKNHTTKCGNKEKRKCRDGKSEMDEMVWMRRNKEHFWKRCSYKHHNKRRNKEQARGEGHVKKKV